MAWVEPVTRTLGPLTYGVADQPASAATHAVSLPGKTDAWKVPCATRSEPVVVLPARPWRSPAGCRGSPGS